MILALAAALALTAPHPDTGVGLARMTVVDSVHHDTMPTLVWYATTSPPKTISLLLQDLDVAMEGDWAGGAARHPLVIISHGTGGNEVGHWDLAESLVRAGYVVVSFRHAGDNHRDHSALGTDRQLLGRPAQVRAVLDGVLHDPIWGPRIDTLRIGFYGFSAGGYTGLVLAGAEPDIRRFAAYCAAEPADPNFCANGIGGRWQMTGRYRDDQHEPRIRAVAVAAPAMSFLFSRDEIRRITVPLFIARGMQDTIVKEPYNVMWLLKNLPRKPEIFLQPGGHYTFLPPCGLKLAEVVPDICADPIGVKRRAVHHDLDLRLTAFLDASLPRQRVDDRPVAR